MEHEINEALLRRVHEQYLRQRQRISLPRTQIGDRTHETRFRASRLYGCPTADYYARTGMPHTHPHTYSLLQRFEQGNRVADAWQEALVWAASLPEYAGLRVQVELPLESETLVGQADMVINGIPVEIKNTSRYQVFGGHLLQLMAYCKMLQAPYGLLVYQSEFRNVITKVMASDELVSQAISRLAAAETPPQGVWEIRPGECVVETDMEDILPHEAKRGNSKTGVKKGDVVNGEGTIRCQYFGHCFPWAQDKYKFVTMSTREQYDAGIVGAVAPVEMPHE